MAGLEQWESSLFYKHGLVALDLVSPNKLHLLDIFVKKQKRSRALGLRNSGAVIVNIGSVLNHRLPSPESAAQWEQLSRDLHQGLESLKLGREPDDDAAFQAEYHAEDITSTHAASSSVLASFFSLARFGPAKRTSSLSFTLRNTAAESVSQDALLHLFGQQQAVWKPDLDAIRLEKPLLMKNGNLELWVVTEIRYADCIGIIECKDSALSAGADLSAAVGTMAALPIPPGTADVSVKTHRGKDGSLLVTGPKIAFGFKAMRLEYDSQGRLVARQSDMGNVRPVQGRRSSHSLPFDLDASIDDMGGLFVHRPEPGSVQVEVIKMQH